MGLGGKKMRLMICVHCAKRCHAGHKGIKYLRTSRVACMCPDIGCDLMRELEAAEADKQDVRMNILAKHESGEVRRREGLATETPAVLALLPERTADDIKQGAIQGWALCRRAAFTEPVDGWQILVDPTQPFEVTVGKTVLVDRDELVGTKVEGKVVDRWVHADKTHRFTIMFDAGRDHSG